MTRVFDEALSQSIADELESFGDGTAIPTEEPNLGTLLRGGAFVKGGDAGSLSLQDARRTEAERGGAGASGMRRIEGALQGGAGQSVPVDKEFRVVPDGYDIMPSLPGYEVLSAILAEAYLQAAAGKGKERHTTMAVGFQPWHLQPTVSSARMVGPGGPAFQAMKKAQEAVTMAGNKNFTGAKAEALGIIHYGAVLFRLLQEMEVSNGQGT